jgi:phenylalanyl-tRNA synthetase beta chain
MPVGQAVSRQPLVRRDLGLVVDETLPVQTLLDALRAAAPAHVIAMELFDVYRGAGLTEGRKSLAILVLMQDTSRTLTDADIDATESQLLAVAHQQFGATRRQ